MVLSTAVLAATVLGAGLAGAAAPADTVVAVAMGLAPVQAVPTNLVGFSIEVPDATEMIGKSPDPPRLALVNLIRGLHHSELQAPTVVRAGGNSADESVWNPDHQALPPQYKITYNITAADLKSYQGFGNAMGGRTAFVPDLSFIRGHDFAWPAAEALAINNSISWSYIHAVSIGNECDLFAQNGLRKPDYDYSQYKAEFEAAAAAITAAGLPAKTIRGATWCCFQGTFNEAAFADYASSQAALLRDISYHRYPLSHCDGHTTTLEDLLAPEASSGQADKMRPFSEGAAAAGVPFVIGESNSVACGGQEGVSDVLGSALWALDFLFEMASINASMVNFHGGPRGIYPPIKFANTSAGMPPTVQPLYYAMRVFSEVTAAESRLLSVNVTQTTNSQVRVWALQGVGKTVFVVIHKDPSAAGPAAVSLSKLETSEPDTAQLGTLSAPGGATAKSGLVWVGLTWDGTTDGTPSGQRTTTSVKRSAAGTFDFSVEPASVAVLWA
ncbi:hypothetical protein FNF29_06964 [Cafeteria roenbergensis]|uniref:Beta-glucuronidase C-terminal domain-containing protein n=1 Tax=Cafeteria roenbergensis TaxID=33653 RepID=A0A5A8DV73_CAFRO|nr:hypothetical protein FNF29_06964 [Cafeteria roenbergensis]KAA0168125.1 hypothetical protein FNF31_00623 [Cafeteria roenbergensis]KAA0169372.1 hypothetical protein FNF28_02153 [Cafeteria roenbergensis]|eukprot:KAA0148020.1 hypothetical protein FNF29_06964 [Cafeteria roenbergensis]